MTEQIDSLIKEARTYLGVVWKHQGRSHKGVDCVGFLINAFKYINVKIIEIRGYSRNPDGIKLKQIMDNQPNLIKILPTEKMKAGDVVLFRIRKDPQHVALVTDSNTANLGIIHAYNGGEKKVVEHDFADYWRQKIVAVYRLK